MGNNIEQIFEYAKDESNNSLILWDIEEENFDINQTFGDKKQTLLHVCALYKNYGLARKLVSKGANITVEDIYYNTPSDIATKNSDSQMLNILQPRANYMLESYCNTYHENKQLKTEKKWLTKKLRTSEKNLKRMREENLSLSESNKRLKREIKNKENMLDIYREDEKN
jgi:ankyrin repeat protein